MDTTFKFYKRFLKGNFSRDVLTSLLAQAIIIILNLIITKIISDNVTVNDFGIYNMAKRGASVIAFIILMGLGISIPRYISIENASNRQEKGRLYWRAALTIVLVGCSIFTVFFIVFREEIAKLLFGNRKYIYMVIPIFINSIGVCLSSLLFAYYRGYNNIFFFNLLQVSYIVILLFLSILIKNVVNLILWWGIIWSGLTLVFFLWNEVKTSKTNLYRFSFREKIDAIFSLVKFGLPRVVGEFALFGYFVVPMIILTHKHNLETVGYMSVSVTFFQLFTTFFGVIGYVLLPYVSEKMAKKEYFEIKVRLRNLFILYLFVSVMMNMFFQIFTRQLTIMFFGEQYIESVIYTRITLLGAIPYVFYLLLRNPLDAVSEFPFNTMNLIISFIVLNGIVYYFDDVLSMALGILISSFVLCLLSWISWLKCTQNWKNSMSDNT